MRLSWFDSETTGVENKIHQMLSFAMVCTDVNFKVVDTLYKKIKLLPHVTPDARALSVNKIDPYGLEWHAEAMEESAFVKEVVAFCVRNKLDINYWLAFNANFDNGFLFSALERNGLILNVADTVCVDPFILAKEATASKKVLTPQKKSKDGRFYNSSTLEDISQSLGTQHKGDAHNALNDVYTLINTTPKLVEKTLGTTDISQFLNNPKYHVKSDKFKKLV